MIRFLARRFLLGAVTLVGITAVTFACTRLLPGEVGEGLRAGTGRTGAAPGAAERRRLHALDEPLPVQYWQWLRRSAALDFGRSWISHRPVSEVLMEAAPRSLQVMLPSILLWYLVGVPLGVFLALRRGRIMARALTAGLYALYSLPAFFVGTLLIVVFCNPGVLGWFPASGLKGDGVGAFGGLAWLVTTPVGWSWLGDRVWHLVLPVACLVYGTAAYLAEQTRASMLESLGARWIRTARAKGLPEAQVVMKHALRGALIPLVTLAALALPAAFTGSVFLEKVFSIEGVGWTFVQAVGERDHPVVMAVTTLAAALTLLGMLAADLLYRVVDPRIELR